MLILVRKVQQAIKIGKNIEIRVLSVERDRVKIGIAAPSDVKVMRQELLEEGAIPTNSEGPTKAAAN
jgi:carbon storage regulator